MRTFIITLVALVATATAWSQPALYNDGALYVGSGGQLYVGGDFTNTASGTIANNGTLTLTGSLTNHAAMPAATGGTLQFSGSVPQSIGGTAPFFATNVVYNNGAGFTLSQTLKAGGLVTFNTGVLSAPTSSSVLQLGPSASVGGASDASYVNGYVLKEGTGSFTFPVGNATRYQPVGVNLTANSAGMLGNYVSGNGGALPLSGLSSYNTGEFWNLVPAGTASGSVTVYWDAFNPIALSTISEARVARNSGAAWINEGGNSSTGTISAGSVTSNALSSFGAFTSGTGCATPTMSAVSNQVLCAGSSSTVIAFSGATNYSWTNNNPSIGLAASGSGSIASFTAVNAGSTPAVATITVTPSDPVCGNGTSQTFTITVNPKSVYQAPMQQFCSAQLPVSWNGLTISGAGTYTAHLSNQYGCDSAVTSVVTVITTVTPSVSITASATAQCGTAPITFNATGVNARTETAAPPQYQWYRNGNPIAGANTASYTENAPADNNTYYVTLRSGLPCVTQQTVSSNTIQIRVYGATSSVTNASVCAEQLPYSWNGQNYSTAGQYVVHLTNAHGCDSAATLNLAVNVCTQAAVGYPGSPYCGTTGTAAPNFTAVIGGSFSAAPAGLAINPGTGVIDLAASAPGTYTVTYGIPGNTASAVVIVRPANVVASIGNLTLCANTPTGTIDFQPLPGISTSWTNDNPSIGLAASGTGNIASFTALNTGTALSVANIVVTPTSGSCTFSKMSFRINVKPVPQMTGTPASQVWCANRMTTAVSLTSATTGATITWTNTNPAIGTGAAGTGSIPSFLTQDNTSTPQTGTFVVTPTLAGCTGTPVSFAITTHPNIDSVVYPGNPFCQAGTVSPTYYGSRGGSFSASPAGLSINPVTGVIALGASIPNTYTITYTVNASNGCNATVTTTILIRPQSGVNPENNQTWCNGASVPSLAWTGPNVVFNWVNDNTSIGLPASGSGNLPAFTAVNTTTVPKYAFVKVYPQGSGSTYCPGKAMQFKITVNPPNYGGCPPVAAHGDTGGGGLTGRSAAPAISVQPNPTTGRALVQLPVSGSWLLQLVDCHGVPVGLRTLCTGTQGVIDLSAVTPGVYLLQALNTRSGSTVQTQVIKF